MTSTETSSATDPTDPAHPTHRARPPLRRLGGVGLTVVVTVAVWALGRLAGADYVLRDPRGDVAIDVVVTAIVTLVVSLLGWGALALLERLSRLAGRLWTWLAAAVVVASMIPIFLVDTTPGTRIALFFVHLAVAVLVPALLWPRIGGARR